MKRRIALVLVFAMLLSCAGCYVNVDLINEEIEKVMEPVEKAGNFISDTVDYASGVVDFLKEGWNTYVSPILKKNSVKEVDGEYYLDDERIENVTIDIVAQTLYSCSFEDCYPKMRRNAIAKYAEYRGVSQDLVAFIADTDVNSFCINWDRWDSLEDTITEAGTQFSYLSLLGKAADNDKIEGFFDGFTSTADSLGKVHQGATVVFRLLELANNDVKDPEKVCIDFINALSSLADLADATGYYSEALNVISEGITMLLKNVDKRYDMYGAYAEVIGHDSIFLDKDWYIVAHPLRWEELLIAEHNNVEPPVDFRYLSLKKIEKNKEGLGKLTPKEAEVMQKYIEFRLRYELNPEGFIELLTKSE